jgi:hypothetical protein
LLGTVAHGLTNHTKYSILSQIYRNDDAHFVVSWQHLHDSVFLNKATSSQRKAKMDAGSKSAQI